MANLLRRRRKSVLEKDNLRLQDWLKKQPHLPEEIDNELLTAFLSGSKNLDTAKQKLDHYYTLRGNAPQLFDFSVRDPLKVEFKEAASAVKLMLLPKPTPEGYRVAFGAVGQDFSKYDQHYFEVRCTMMCELALLMYPEMTGILFIFDLYGADSTLLEMLTPDSTITVHWFQNTVPVTLKKGLFYNAPHFTDNIMGFIKPFLKPEIAKRLTVTARDRDVLREHLPVEMLPSDYGGAESSSDTLNDYWLNLLEKKRDWFYNTSFHLSDEKRRPSIVTDNIAYGVDGVFRSLSLE